ncbi:MAG: site-specific integrase [Bdellovibrionales bacterium]|nr:site-specific integrase [Bdellovibrionales bacterium]MCB0408539.1 site-specific integrase [Bdellovibrionales bacterium]
MSKKKYVNVPKHPGIRKNLITGKYLVAKRIKGKQFSETFDSLRKAQHWKNTFDGQKVKRVEATTSTLGEVWEAMKHLHFPGLEKSTQDIWERRWKHLSDLKDYHMEEITSSVINDWIERKKKWFESDEYDSLGRGYAGRCNLNNELNLFTTIFNWYKAEDEFEAESALIPSPIRRRHKKMSFFRDTPKNPEDKKIPVEAAFEFFSYLPELYSDLAMTQYFCAGRIGETAGIQISNIYLDQDKLVIKDSCVWGGPSKMFQYLKPYPKNKEPRTVFLHPWLRKIIERRLALKAPNCDFLFHVKGRPLNYCTIQSNYRQAQTKSGIPYTGTHCLRHGMATLARRVGGMGLDSVIAMTGHKDLKLADHYSKIDSEVQKETSTRIVEHISEVLGLSGNGSESSSEKGKMRSNVVQLRRVK